MKMRNHKKLIIVIGVTVIVLGGGVGYLGAINGWWGGGGSIPSDTFTRGLVGYWGFEEGSGTTAYDGSGNSNTGTLTNGPKWTTAKSASGPGASGPVGGALSFDGVDDYVDAGTGASLDVTTLTLEVWAKWDSIDLAHHNVVLGRSTITRWPFIHVDGGGAPTKIAMYFYDGSWHQIFYTPSSITGVWFHIVGTYDPSLASNNLKLYVDGVLRSQTDATSAINDAGSTWIGKGYSDDSNMDGTIDEVRIYNRALSAEEVRYHYNRGGPVAQWKFDEGSGDTAYDSTSNNNDGAISGATWVSGKNGNALSFDGSDDYVSLGNNALGNLGDQFTISAWIKTVSTAYQTIIAEYQSGVCADSSFSVRYGNDYVVYFHDGAAGSSIGKTVVNDGQWHHAVFVSDISNSYIYVDGEIDAVNADVDWRNTCTNVDVRIGSRVDMHPFNGSIDDVRIYNYARTPDEIRLDYNAGFGVRFGGSPADDMTRGLVGYWSMDEASGPLVFDKSSQGNDGMINDGGSGNPVSYWTFDEGTGQTAYDYTGSNNGTLGSSGSADSADPVWTSSGRVGGALQFDAVNDHVDCGNNSSFNVTNAITIEAWVYPTNASTDPGYVVSRMNSNDQGFVLGIRPSAYQINFPYSGGNRGKQIDVSILNQWSHLVGIFDNGIVKIYRNGELKGTADFSGTGNVVNGDNVFIGDGQYLVRSLGATIDDVRIYNYARGAAQIKRDYLETYKSKYSGDTPPLRSGASNGAALRFDGVDDYVSAADFTLISTQNNADFSLETWVKPETSVASKAIIVKNEEIRLTTDASGYPRCEIYSSGAWQTAATSSQALSLGNWQYLTCRYDKANLKIYFNGVEKGTSALTSAVNNATSSFDIGKDASGGSAYFSGVMDEVRAYNRALSAEEIRYHYNRGGPVAYWSFDSGSGSVAYDATESNNDGTISGATWTTGKYGTALSFDGADEYVNIDSVWTPVSNLTVGSVVGWIKFNVATGQRTLISFGDTDADTFLVLGCWDEKLTGIFKLAGTYYWYVQTDDIVFVTDTWYQIGIYHNGIQPTLILNGQAPAQTFSVFTDKTKWWDDLTGVDNARIGVTAKSSLITYDHNGLIDDVRIYNYARSASEIRTDYNEGFAARFGPSAQSPYDCDKDPAGCMSKGLVGYWNMDEGNGDLVYDQSSYKNTGYARPYGKALSFDGTDDAVDAGNDASLNITSAITIEAWVKPFAWEYPGGNYARIVAKGQNEAYQLMMYQFAGFMFNIGARSTPYASTGAVNLNQFYHIVGTYDGQDAKIYLDGVYKDTETFNETIPTVADPLIIGSWNPSGDMRPFPGFIDEVRIYNRALSTTEVTEHYKGIFSNETGLIGYWPFNEQSGTKTYDKSGNRNDGTLYNFNWTATSGWKNNAPQYSEGAPNPSASSGRQGTSLSFDGVDDYVSAADFTLISTQNNADFSLEAWVNPETSVASKAIIVKNEEIRLTTDSSGYPQCEIYSSSAWQTAAVSTQVLSLGSWQYLTCRYDKTNLKIYFNGVEKGSSALFSAVNNATSSFDLGKDASGGSAYFSGAMDEVRAYNRALSAAEIRYHYNRGGPVAHWKFDEGSGTTAYDSTNNDNDGTITGASWTTGKFGSALSFDGDDYVVSGSNVTGVSAFSHSLWFKSSDGSFSADEYLFSQGTDDPSVYLESTDNKVKVMADGVDKLSSASTVNDTNWHHLEITADGTNIYLYLDGKKEAQIAYTGSSATATVKIASNVTPASYFDGLIDDVRIYNYARTPEQIRIDYNAGLSVHFK